MAITIIIIRVNDMNIKKVLLLMHIPKAAGTSFTAAVQNNFRKSESVNFAWQSSHERYPNNFFKRKKKRELAKYNFYSGHFIYGVHTKISRPCSYITMLRNPNERLISAYNYITTQSSYINKYLPQVKRFTFDEFLFSKDIPNWHQLDNTQTRFISGLDPKLKLRSEDLLVAKENLIKNIDFFGITEEFDKSMILLKKDLNLKFLFYTRERVTKISKIDKLDHFIDLLENYNRLDNELYQYAKEIFNKRTKKISDYEMKKYSRLNTLYQRLCNVKQNRIITTYYVILQKIIHKVFGLRK